MPVSTVSYAASQSLATTGLEGLASSAGLVAGWQSDLIDNRTLKYLDALVSGAIAVGTTPTVNTQIFVYAWGQLENTGPTRPDSFGTTQGARSITSVGVGQGFLKPIAALNVDATNSGRIYPFGPVSLATLFGRVLPQQWGIWVVHNNVAALSNGSGAHKIWYDGIKLDVS